MPQFKLSTTQLHHQLVLCSFYQSFLQNCQLSRNNNFGSFFILFNFCVCMHLVELAVGKLLS